MGQVGKTGGDLSALFCLTESSPTVWLSEMQLTLNRQQMVSNRQQPSVRDLPATSDLSSTDGPATPA